MSENSTFRRQGIDHLGFLNGQLRGLMGYTALANELTQNADDAKAKNLIFDVSDAALIVENDSTFSECKTVDDDDCSSEIEKGFLCDFHRFLQISSGDKRHQEDNTGAFGIGFTTVYQITDHPELFSRTMHWIVRPEESEYRRIKQNKISYYKSTRFYLPWARDPETIVRRRLDVSAVSEKNIEQLFSDIEKAISDTIMFLKHVRRIQLKRNGNQVKEVFIERDEGSLTVRDGNQSHKWLLFEGDFADKAEGLGNNYPKHRRKSEVSIAVPINNSDINGLLFAYLPTEQKTGLPFHINADFFPKPDRKEIIFGDDHQGDWNRLAIGKAAEVLSDQLSNLTDVLGARGFWNFIGKLQKVARAAENGQLDEIFDSFWTLAKNQLKQFPCVYTSQGKWIYPSSAYILQNYKTEKPIIPILEKLNLNIAHEELASYQNILRSGDVGVRQFKLINLAEGLFNNGLNELIAFERAPEWLRQEENHQILADEIKYLLDNTQSNEEGVVRIKECAIAKSCGDNFATPESIYKIDEATREYFSVLELNAYFLANDNPPVIAELAEEFTVKDAIETLETCDEDTFSTCLEVKPDAFVKLINWLVNECLNSDENTKESLRNLKIWLSDGKLFALDDLVVPGGFEDFLKLASVVDLKTLKISPDKLIEIGAKELTFQTYITDQLSHALRRSHSIEPKVYQQLVEMFAARRSEIADDNQIRNIIASFPIIECQDKKFRAASSVYFSSNQIKQLLGLRTAAYIDPIEAYPRSIQELFRWLGVGIKPRLKDLLAQIDEAVQPSPTQKTRELIQRIFVHLGERWNEFEDKSVFETLKNKSWLPAKNDIMRWHMPRDLFAPYQDYLFETTGKFIDVPRNEIRSLAKFVDGLGIKSTPTVKLVVDHLRNRMRENLSVNIAVYTFLDQQHTDPLVAGLQNTNCIWLNEKYVSADKIFWSDHPFGSHRHRLGVEMAQYKNLFNVLGVKDSPDYTDTITVLREISAQFAPENLQLDEENQKVVRYCWLKLHDALEDELMDLCDIPVVLTNSNRLEKPENLFFDDFPGIAEELGIAQQAIPRPADIWQPMHAAGIKFLSEVVQTNLIEAANPVDDNQLTQKLAWGRECIVRVVEAARWDSDFDYDTTHLSKINFVKTSKLSIRYSIPESNHSSEIIQTPAYYDDEKKTIYYQSSNLNGISRELARSISAQTDVGLLASGIKEILSAESFEEAVRNLNDLGFALVDQSEIGQAAATTISSLGEAFEEEEEFYDSISEEDESFEEPSDETDPAQDEFDEQVAFGNEPLRKFGANLDRESQPTNNSGQTSQNSPAQPDNHNRNYRLNLLSSDGSKRNTQSAERHKSADSSGIGNSISNQPNKKSQSKLPKAQGRFLSYVENSSHEKEPQVKDEAKKQRNKKIDASGIQKVLDFEEKHGRDPLEMGHSNPGYDIKSFNQDGKLERLIEVKSTSGEWNSYGVKLSDKQYEKCKEEGDRYWLYVVERADQPNAKIYCIQNPAAQVTNYCFDQGWKSVNNAN